SRSTWKSSSRGSSRACASRAPARRAPRAWTGRRPSCAARGRSSPPVRGRPPRWAHPRLQPRASSWVHPRICASCTASWSRWLRRVLQGREYERVGSNDLIRLDVRLVATSNRNTSEMVARSKFREDLFYRLNVVPIEIPPLRERREDIPYLVEHFVRRFCDENG